MKVSRRSRETATRGASAFRRSSLPSVGAVGRCVLPPSHPSYMDTPFLQAAFRIVGGVLVFVVGTLIGSS